MLFDSKGREKDEVMQGDHILKAEWFPSDGCMQPEALPRTNSEK